MPIELAPLMTLLNAGRHAELEDAAWAVLDRHPEAGPVWQLYAAALSAQDKDALPALARAAGLMPDDPVLFNNLGNALARNGRLEEALANYDRALNLRPDFAEAHGNLGRALLSLGRPHAALMSCRRALALRPGVAHTHFNLANALLKLGRLSEAQRACERALLIEPDFCEAHCCLGVALRLQGRTAQAKASCAAALRIDSRFSTAFAVLAEAFADEGDFAQARRFYEQLIVLDADSPQAWAGLARLRKMTADDAPWLAQVLRIVSKTLPAHEEMALRYALGKYYDDIGRYELAWSEWQLATQIARLSGPRHDKLALTAGVDRITRFIQADWLRSVGTAACSSSRPVFIIGMLRSGTTLVEQILASHPAVFAAGELTFWDDAAAALFRPCGEFNASADALRRHAGEYLKLLQRLSPGARHVVDKMPTNFAHLGLIHAAFPRARIIHMQRDPMDTCLSLYSQHFEAGVSYANDLEDLAHFYGEYERLMRHWRMHLPADAILDVSYEGLVGEPARWTRQMLQFIGLQWAPQCLDFANARRPVLTASKWQVRQKIYGSSVGRWRRYEHLLPALTRSRLSR